MTERTTPDSPSGPDLDALADRLEGKRTSRSDSTDRATAARILRAVAAAPGSLRTDTAGLGPEWSDWFDALADAVGEP